MTRDEEIQAAQQAAADLPPLTDEQALRIAALLALAEREADR
jgi:hypothetical protein